MNATQTQWRSRIASCESALRRAGAACEFASDSGSRYFRLNGQRIRVADHDANGDAPPGADSRWQVEIRVDREDWIRPLLHVTGPYRTNIGEVPAATYFADQEAWSQSMLKTFMDRRRLAHAYYVAKTASEPERKEDGKLRIDRGNATHTALLEPWRFDHLVVGWPAGMLSDDGGIRTKEAKAYRDEQRAAGKIILKDHHLQAVKAMAESVRRVTAEWIDKPARREQCIYWTDEATGLPCKMRFDWLIIGSRPVFFDLKTTNDASPSAFKQRCEQLSYDIQQAHYVDGGEQVLGVTPLFLFIAVEDTYPFSCAIHQLDEPSADNGRQNRNTLLANVKTCLESGDWREPWESTINPLSLRPRLI